MEVRPTLLLKCTVQSLDTSIFNKAGVITSSNLYDSQLIELTREAFKEAGVKLTEGPYCYFALPNYESPAEI